MASSRRSKRLVVGLLLAASLSGCVDYMNNWDRVSSRSGNAMEANTAIMGIEPSYTSNTSTRVGS